MHIYIICACTSTCMHIKSLNATSVQRWCKANWNTWKMTWRISRIKWLIKVPFTGNCIAGVIILAVIFLLLKLTELDEPSSLEEQEKIQRALPLLSISEFGKNNCHVWVYHALHEILIKRSMLINQCDPYVVLHWSACFRCGLCGLLCFRWDLRGQRRVVCTI